MAQEDVQHKHFILLSYTVYAYQQVPEHPSTSYNYLFILFIKCGNVGQWLSASNWLQFSAPVTQVFLSVWLPQQYAVGMPVLIFSCGFHSYVVLLVFFSKCALLSISIYARGRLYFWVLFQNLKEFSSAICRWMIPELGILLMRDSL